MAVAIKEKVVEELGMMLAETGELLGPESTYALQRSKLRDEYTPVIAAAAKVTVTDHDSAEEAVKYGRLLQNGTKETEDFFKKIKQMIDAIKKPVLQAEKDDQALIDKEKARLAGELTEYRAKVEAERREAQRKAEEEAAAIAKAEQERLEREAREEQLKLAVELDLAGDHEQAESVLNETVVVEPIVAAPVVVQAAAPARFAGSTGRVNYSAKVTDLKALVRAIAEGKAPLESVQANDTFINQQARAFKEGFNMPGCKLERTTSTSFRG